MAFIHKKKKKEKRKRRICLFWRFKNVYEKI